MPLRAVIAGIDTPNRCRDMRQVVVRLHHIAHRRGLVAGGRQLEQGSGAGVAEVTDPVVGHERAEGLLHAWHSRQRPPPLRICKIRRSWPASLQLGCRVNRRDRSRRHANGGSGVLKGWGLGRHVLGSNYFHYVRDPWGSHCEYSSDIDYIPANCDWKGGDHAPEDSFYVWGPEPPADFVHNYEAG